MLAEDSGLYSGGAIVSLSHATNAHPMDKAEKRRLIIVTPRRAFELTVTVLKIYTKIKTRKISI